MAIGLKPPNRYKTLVEKIFFDRYKKGATLVAFVRADLEAAAAEMKIKLPKNLGDILYSFRYRAAMPDRVLRWSPKTGQVAKRESRP